MRKSKFTDSQIMDAVKQVEAGFPVPDICRELGISTATFYKWRAKYGVMDVSMIALAFPAVSAAIEQPACQVTEGIGMSLKRGYG